MGKGFVASLATLVAGLPLTFAQAPPAVSLGRPVTASQAVSLAKPVAVNPGPVVPVGWVGSAPVSLEAPLLPAKIRGQMGECPAFCCPRPACAPSGCWDCPAGDFNPTSWASAEYLLFSIKDGPLPLGAGDLDYGWFSGGRVTAGSWLDASQGVGLEGSAFLLERRSDGLMARGVTLPGTGPTATGALFSATRLWGLEANGLVNLSPRGTGAHAELLGGFRFLSLGENLDAQAVAIAGVNGALANGAAAANFQTQNRFYGGQLGARAGFRFGSFSADITGKLALGWTHEAVNLTAYGTGIPGVLPGTPAFVSRETHKTFTFLPEVQLRVGADVTRNVQVFVSYDFLYLHNVVRPGDQVTVGRPFLFNETDFWAQGLTFGVELRY